MLLLFDVTGCIPLLVILLSVFFFILVLFFFFSVAEEFLHLRQWSAPRFGSFNTFRGGLLLRPDVRTFLFAYTVAFDC